MLAIRSREAIQCSHRALALRLELRRRAYYQSAVLLLHPLLVLSAYFRLFCVLLLSYDAG
jgi:hypothetical protein